MYINSNNEYVEVSYSAAGVPSPMMEKDIQWAMSYIRYRCDMLQECDNNASPQPDGLIGFPAPEMEGECGYVQLLDKLLSKEEVLWMQSAERLVLAITLMPYLYPKGLEPLLQLEQHQSHKAKMGKSLHAYTHKFHPTPETALFLIAGDNITLRARALRIFQPDHPLSTENVLVYHAFQGLHDVLESPLKLSEEYYSTLVLGKPYRPAFSMSFAANHLTTREDWEDLITYEETLYGLQDINLWLEQKGALYRDELVMKKTKKGYRALFYGPSGTGKTMSAALIGKRAGLPVYRVDLSAVVSKYIGETEKNLETIFLKAEHKDWILFFDEADALFGKRSTTNTANDRYANQEISYLLQRIEDFNGLVILSTNLKANMDVAFTRRFQSIIKFMVPDEEMSKRLFLCVFKGRYALQDSKQLVQACRKDIGLTGAEINNIFQYCAIRVLKNDLNGTPADIFNDAVVTEMKKKKAS